jgi:hypothetical protein
VQGEVIEDCLLVVADADGEAAQVGLVVGFCSDELRFQVAAAGAGGHHLGECDHVGGERVDVRTADPDGLELGCSSAWKVVGLVTSQRVIWRIFGTAGVGSGGARACRNGRV